MFGVSSVHEARSWKNLLNQYESALGQCINYQKSKVYFFNMNIELRRKIIRILGCKEMILPNTYLHLPLIVKEVSMQY